MRRLEIGIRSKNFPRVRLSLCRRGTGSIAGLSTRQTRSYFVNLSCVAVFFPHPDRWRLIEEEFSRSASTSCVSGMVQSVPPWAQALARHPSRLLTSRKTLDTHEEAPPCWVERLGDLSGTSSPKVLREWNTKLYTNDKEWHRKTTREPFRHRPCMKQILVSRPIACS